MDIIFATNNAHKLSEIRHILGPQFNILSLQDIGCHDDIPETATTLEGNALQKAQYIARRYPMMVFADDTGLEVDALNGEPGVHSARYADNTDHDSQANMAKLLHRLQPHNNRHARFRTVIALIRNQPNDLVTFFEGRIEGTITTAPQGTNGFGYDPIFQPDGHDKTFGQLPDEIKNTISHRAQAVEKLANYLRSMKRNS